VLPGVVSRAAAGERAALAELYDAHAPALRRFARTLTGETASAEDLVHDVFVALPRALQRFRAEGSLESFLLSIAAHKARNHVRQAMRARAAAAKLGRSPSMTAETPERALENEQLRLALSGALDALPLKQRLAFVLCDIEGLSSDEAARVLEVPAATVRTRLHHARAELRVRLMAVRS
jgi:RNA polymerase sigma-70 factor (ECF subfamily)